MARRIVGVLCSATGVLLLSIAGGRYAVGALRADAARRAWNDENARRAVASATADERRRWSDLPVAVGIPVARLSIPRLGLDEIVLEGVGDNELNAGPGHLPGSVLPGALGNSIISAHRDRHFRRFDELRVGDTIRTEAVDVVQTWVVVSRRVIDREAPALFATRDRTLTLTTCWPIRLLGAAPDRLIVTAKPAGPGAG